MNSRRITLFSGVVLVLCLIGWGYYRTPAIHSVQIPAGIQEPPDLFALRQKGNDLFLGGHYRLSAEVYQKGCQTARAHGQLRSALRFLNNLGSAHYQLFQYREALKSYLEARNIAAGALDRETLGAICFNLSSLYLQMGNAEAATESAEQGLRALSGISADFKPKLLIQLALVKLKRRDAAGAVRLLRDAVAIARQDLDFATEAQAWNELGNALLESGDTKAAERPLLEAFRIRKLTHDDRIYFSYETLGRLRVLQGDLGSAEMLFGRAIDAARRVSPVAIWNGYYARGAARLAEGRLRDAFADFGAALNWLERWRAEVLPADAFRVSSEVELHEIFSAFVNAAARLYRQTGRTWFAAQAFAAAERGRAASLRLLWAESDNVIKKLPLEYWEKLSRLHADEAALARSEETETPPALRELRVQLAEMEAAAGLSLPNIATASGLPAEGTLEQVRRMLGPDEVYFGFGLDAGESWLWAVARDGFQLRQLPPREQVSAIARSFFRAVSGNAPDAPMLGRHLYAQLFGGVARPFLDKPIWIVAPDGALFDVPFAALVEDSGVRSDTMRYVVEDHAIQITPGIWSQSLSRTKSAGGPFVGLGDPIYNSADPRFLRPAAAEKLSGRFDSPPRAPEAPLQFPRLVGSGDEIENCARLWETRGSQAILLEGASASKENLMKALRQTPAVLHVAAHILFPAQNEGSGFIALTIQPNGGADLLSTTEIGSLRTKVGLVILNGCSSAQGVILPGAGLMGMTRAWLAAGAQAVVATRWAMRNDSGEFFLRFYEFLQARERPLERNSLARALQQAQLTVLRSGGRKSAPADWSAYMYVGRN